MRKQHFHTEAGRSSGSVVLCVPSQHCHQKPPSGAPRGLSWGKQFECKLTALFLPLLGHFGMKLGCRTAVSTCEL